MIGWNSWARIFWFLFICFCSWMLRHHVFNSSAGWEKCWEQGLTPWDLGQATPIVVHLHQSGALPKGRALVPGCGTVSFVMPFDSWWIVFSLYVVTWKFFDCCITWFLFYIFFFPPIPLLHLLIYWKEQKHENEKWIWCLAKD